MDKTVYQVMKQERLSIIEKWKKEMNNYQEFERELTNVTDDVFQNTNLEYIEKLLNHASLENETISPDLRDFFERIIQVGWPLNYLTKGLQAFRRVAIKTVLDKNYDMEKAINVYDLIDRSVDGLLNEIVKFSNQTWRNTISVQKTALLELSAPLIPVFEQITVMPLIGTIDTERAKLIMENLLEGVINHRSQVVLIDITGVPVVDTMVAHHIIQAAEAVRLIGSKCILVGIRPEIAQTIVNLGIDLSDFPTRSTLLKGIESALELTNKKIESLS
ncbi:STAS domain-containing protein [Alkalihalobacillus sp. AL-G]|uniref:STAS domain-containing protein n=1 Tax=Alkalihalobacillus sp. AL-G TaxID=2926399 RepID=UPI00272AD683|nr:STAS domain-containing protein [Alkalihalobacillus sp. AL-G]WLD93666.1 STAS domain-containing protein [Alkalihalobacillus sp. AL-G]